MGRSSRPQEADLPVFDADATPIGTTAVGRTGAALGQRPPRARGVGIAVGLLGLLIGGVAVGGIIDRPATSPSPSGLAAATPVPTISPDCRPAGRSSVPSFRLLAEGSDTLGAAGVIGYLSRPGATTISRGWLVPPIGERTLQVDGGQAVELRTEPTVCIRAVLAEYAPASIAVPAASEIEPLPLGPLDPPLLRPSLGALPAGEWVVRVVAYFWTDIAGAEGQVAGERFFRVQVGDGPFPTPTPTPRPSPSPRPGHTPDVACGPVPSDPATITVTLAATGVEPVPGVGDPGAARVIELPLGSAFDLEVGDRVCATNWVISMQDEATPADVQTQTITNPTDDPAVAIENRWRLRGGFGDYTVTAVLHFGPDVEITRVWRVHYLPFDTPRLFLVGAGGRRTEALPGCGLTINLANGGYSAGDSCGSIGYQPGEPLRVEAGTVATLDLSGWTISSWNGTCGTVVTDESGIQRFESTGCDLGGFDPIQPNAPPPGPARFVVRTGEWIVQFGIQGALDGNSFSVPYYATVIGE